MRTPILTKWQPIIVLLFKRQYLGLELVQKKGCPVEACTQIELEFSLHKDCNSASNKSRKMFITQPMTETTAHPINRTVTCPQTRTKTQPQTRSNNS